MPWVATGVVAIALSLAPAVQAATRRHVLVTSGQVLVEKGAARSRAYVCLEAQNRRHRWVKLTCAHAGRDGRFVLRWRVPTGLRSEQARIAYFHLRIRVVRRLTLKPASVKRVTLPNPLQDYALHLVFWTPPGAALNSDVQPDVAQLENDVQAALAAGDDNNTFAVPALYPAGDPRIASIDVTDTSDSIPVDSTETWCEGISQLCATPAQIGDEVTHLSRHNGWAGGAHALTLIILGQPVIACADATTCSQAAEACGYHSMVTTTTEAYAFAVISMSGANAECGDSGVAPPDAHYAINLIGHEQDEAVVDPNGDGKEIADPCEGQFGFNSINGHEYSLPYLMLPSGQCSIVDEFVAQIDASFAIQPSVGAIAGDAVTFTPSSDEDPGGDVTYDDWCFGDGTQCDLGEGVVTHIYASPGTYYVTHYVEDLDGQNAYSQMSITVS